MPFQQYVDLRKRGERVFAEFSLGKAVRQDAAGGMPVVRRDSLADTAIGAVRAFIYRQIACELPPAPPQSKIVPIYGPGGPIRTQPAAPAGPESCPKPEKFFRTRYTCMCVRG